MIGEAQFSRSAPLLEVRDLATHFPVRRGGRRRVADVCRAVDGVSFDIARGMILGLVGESGCGKTTLARTIVRLIKATGGGVRFDGLDVFAASRAQLRRLRRDLQIVFQDPFGSLNPRLTVGRIVGEPLVIHRLASGRERGERVAQVLEDVGLSPDCAGRYPHEFSGGQRQRIGIARAVVVSPRFIICDEPVSALDVSIQSQILNLLGDLQKQRGLTYLLVAHNLAVVRHLSDRVAVMYLGKLVEIADTDDLYAKPAHPYTAALLASAPEPDPTLRHRATVLEGDVPSPIDPPPGCAFHPRCPYATEECRRITPRLEEVSAPSAGDIGRKGAGSIADCGLRIADRNAQQSAANGNGDREEAAKKGNEAMRQRGRESGARERSAISRGRFVACYHPLRD